MTLIILANLSDRIYMSADTRLSKREKDTSVTKIHDNQLKIQEISGNIIIGCAGSAKMSSFVVKKLKNDKDVNNLGIDKFKQFLEKRLHGIIHEYLISVSEDNRESNAVFMIAGYNRDKNKIIDSGRIMSSLKKYQEVKQKEIDTIGNGKDIMDFTQEEYGALKYQMLKNKQTIKPIVSNSINNSKGDGLIELPISDQKSFIVEIDCSNKQEPIKYIECEWNEIKVRGTNLHDKDIPKRFWGDLEFGLNSGDVMKDGLSFINFIQEKFSGSINGAVTNYIIMDNNILVTTGTVGPYNKNNKQLVSFGTDFVGCLLHRRDSDGNLHKLNKLSDYFSDGECFL